MGKEDIVVLIPNKSNRQEGMAKVKNEVEDQDPLPPLEKSPKNNSCPTCSKEFKFPWQLKRHVPTHDRQVREVEVFM